MLNLLYSNFDAIVEQFSAFKVTFIGMKSARSLIYLQVENVGDAYLIVSGIPEMENQTHLCEVCNTALRSRDSGTCSM